MCVVKVEFFVKVTTDKLLRCLACFEVKTYIIELHFLVSGQLTNIYTTMFHVLSHPTVISYFFPSAVVIDSAHSKLAICELLSTSPQITFNLVMYWYLYSTIVPEVITVI